MNGIGKITTDRLPTKTKRGNDMTETLLENPAAQGEEVVELGKLMAEYRHYRAQLAAMAKTIYQIRRLHFNQKQEILPRAESRNPDLEKIYEILRNLKVGEVKTSTWTSKSKSYLNAYTYAKILGITISLRVRHREGVIGIWRVK